MSLNQILYTLPFVLLNRVSFSGFVFVFASVSKFLLWISSNLKLSFLLVFVVFFFLIFAFLDKILCYSMLIVSLSARYLLKYEFLDTVANNRGLCLIFFEKISDPHPLAVKKEHHCSLHL